jgi:GNAT superfamily N-acetyltransferase
MGWWHASRRLCDTEEVDLVIRNLQLRDRSRWNELYSSYLDFYETSRTAEELERIWRQVTGSSSTTHALVAEADGRVVGLAHYSYVPSTWARVANCYLEDLFVEHVARGHGFAQRLIAEVRATAKSFGCTEMYWITAEDNAVARRTYAQVATKSIFVRYEIDLEDVPTPE